MSVVTTKANSAVVSSNAKQHEEYVSRSRLDAQDLGKKSAYHKIIFDAICWPYVCQFVGGYRGF